MQMWRNRAIISPFAVNHLLHTIAYIFFQHRTGHNSSKRGGFAREMGRQFPHARFDKRSVPDSEQTPTQLQTALKQFPLLFDTTRPVLGVPAVFRKTLSLKAELVKMSCFARGSGDPTSRKRFTKASTHIVFVTIFAAQGFCAPVRSISGSV